MAFIVENGWYRQETRTSRQKEFGTSKTFSRVKSGYLLSEYIKEKYRETYEEAVAFYNYVNELHPQKYDIRKTQEFKAMKNGMMFVIKRPKIVRQMYTPITTTGEHEITITATDEQSETLPSIEQSETLPSIEQSETLPSIEQAETLPSIEQAETLPSTEQAETLSSTQQAETLPKTMQLHIPLMSPEEISTMVFEENLLGTLSDQLQPTLDEEIPEEVYNKIISELRLDPDLSKLMDDIEQDIGEQDIDLPIEEDRLELELQNWEMW